MPEWRWRCQSWNLPNNYAHKMFKYLCKQCLGPSAGAQCCRQCVCVCVLNHQTCSEQCTWSQVARFIRWHFTLSLALFLSSICSQIDLDIYIVRFDCNTTSGREWWGRGGGTVDQWLLLLFNQLKLWTRVTQSQATSCPICLATGRAHVPHLNISQARLPKQSRHEQKERGR